MKNSVPKPNRPSIFTKTSQNITHNNKKNLQSKPHHMQWKETQFLINLIIQNFQEQSIPKHAISKQTLHKNVLSNLNENKNNKFNTMRAFKSWNASCMLLSVLSHFSCSLLNMPATPTILTDPSLPYNPVGPKPEFELELKPDPVPPTFSLVTSHAFPLQHSHSFATNTSQSPLPLTTAVTTTDFGPRPDSATRLSLVTETWKRKRGEWKTDLMDLLEARMWVMLESGTAAAAVEVAEDESQRRRWVVRIKRPDFKG